jgi:PleD family two-component response regulator
VISVLALSVDQFDAYRKAKGETAARSVLAEVSRALRRLVATIGIVAASYRNGIIVLVAPEVSANAARELGETLRKTVARLRLPNSESVVSDYVTASVVASTGRVKRTVDSVQLLTHSISKLKDVTGAGGDRVLAMTI